MGFKDNEDYIPDLDYDETGLGVDLNRNDYDDIPDLDIDDDDAEDNAEPDDDGSAAAQESGGGDAPQDNKGNNDVIAQLSGMFKQYGIEHDVEQYKGKGMTIEQAKQVFRHELMLEGLSKVNPSYAAALRHGINPNAYHQQVSQYNTLLSLDSDNRVKDHLFKTIYKSEHEAGTLPDKEDEIEAHIAEQVEARYAKMSEEKRKKMDEALVNHYKKGMEELPAKMKEAETAHFKASLEKYNKEVDKYIEDKKTSEYIEKGGGIPYGKPEDKAAFKQYVKEMLSIKGDTGQPELFRLLNEDGVFMMDVMRLMYEHKKGSLKNVSDKATKEVLNKLDSFGSGAGADGGVASDEVTYGGNKYLYKDPNKKKK